MGNKGSRGEKVDLINGLRLYFLIEIEIPEGSIGDTVDVFVVLPAKPKDKKRSVLEMLEEIHAKRPPKSAEEIDRQLREERDSWDS